jgi:hypothetical protein
MRLALIAPLESLPAGISLLVGVYLRRKRLDTPIAAERRQESPLPIRDNTAHHAEAVVTTPSNTSRRDRC